MSGNQQETLTPEEFLEHFGVKGMKWGVRRATARTDKQIRRHQNAMTNKGVIGKAAQLDKLTWGRNGRFEGYHNKRISELERSKERISEGELVVRTLLLGPRYSRK